MEMKEVRYGARILYILNTLNTLTPPPPLLQKLQSPLIRQVLKAKWLCLLGFAGELGKGAGEKVTHDGLSHGSCLGQKKIFFKVQCVICCLSAQTRRLILILPEERALSLAGVIIF